MLDAEQIEAVRDCLCRITDDERARLWHLLEPMVRAIDNQDVTAVTAAVGRVPDGPMRRCLLAVAKPFIATYRAAVREYGSTGVQLRDAAPRLRPSTAR